LLLPLLLLLLPCRRVSVGIEVVKDPAIIFLDEPTTGLDSEMALGVITSLKAMAKAGKMVRGMTAAAAADFDAGLPGLQFCSNPFSGPDLRSANYKCCTVLLLLLLLLQVVATIHQPNSLITDHFDDWALLAKGRLLYAGPWAGALPYFEAAGHACPLYRNPTDFFMSLASSPASLAELADAWVQQVSSSSGSSSSMKRVHFQLI
jgi:ABC-type multidrug transport system ATPase subunit